MGSSGDNNAPHPYTAAYRGLEAAVGLGKIRYLGVSNFQSERVEHLISVAAVKPLVWQRQCNLYDCLTAEMVRLAETHELALTGFGLLSPTSGMLNPHEDAHVRAVAEKHGRTTADVLLAWALAVGVIP